MLPPPDQFPDRYSLAVKDGLAAFDGCPAQAQSRAP
jgi:hypothetical protein